MRGEIQSLTNIPYPTHTTKTRASRKSPTAEDQWVEPSIAWRSETQIDADARKLAMLRLTMGGEPTFVSIDDMEAPEWNTTALTANDKRKLAGETAGATLRDNLCPGRYGCTTALWVRQMVSRRAHAHAGPCTPVIWRADGCRQSGRNPELLSRSRPGPWRTVLDRRRAYSGPCDLAPKLCRYRQSALFYPAYEDVF